jgi:hypothetical protein
MNTNKTQTEQLTQDAVMQSVLKNQVRIGNLVDFDGRIETVYAIRNSGVDFYRGKTKNGVMMQSYVWEAIKPILLTEEWLNKFGFEMKGFYRLKVTSFLELCWKPHNKTLNIQTEKNGFTEDSKVRYIHELQNLYFALTQRELTVA